jgi:putative FmdB family regulatory protein
MPIYEYKCSDCNKMTSIFSKSYTWPEQVTCEHCGGVRTHRAISQVAFSSADPMASDPESHNKFMPLLKHQFPQEFERRQPGESEESVAARLKKGVDKQMDQMIMKTMEKIKD